MAGGALERRKPKTAIKRSEAMLQIMSTTAKAGGLRVRHRTRIMRHEYGVLLSLCLMV